MQSISNGASFELRRILDSVIPTNPMKIKSTYNGKTAKEWFKLHEVMRRDFGRVLKELQRTKSKLDESN